MMKITTINRQSLNPFGGFPAGFLQKPPEKKIICCNLVTHKKIEEL